MLKIMMNLKNYKVYYEPFPHLIFEDVFNEKFYDDMSREFPSIEKLESIKDKIKNEMKQEKYVFDNKSLKKKEFINFIKDSNNLKLLYNHLISIEFNNEINKVLLENHIDIGINKLLNYKSIKKRILEFFFNIKITTSVEFSIMKCNSGFLKPHTDGSNKIFSFVIPMIDDNKILNAKNIGTSIRITTEDKYRYNFQNKTVPFELTKEIREIPFKKNQLLLLIKTHNSLHSVGPIIFNDFKNENLFRKSITGFLEKNYYL
jgi:hypothetical protein